MTPSKPVLTVTLVGKDNAVTVTGISEDETIIHATIFPSLITACRWLQRQYQNHYRVILNIHPSARSI